MLYYVAMPLVCEAFRRLRSPVLKLTPTASLALSRFGKCIELRRPFKLSHFFFFFFKLYLAGTLEPLPETLRPRTSCVEMRADGLRERNHWERKDGRLAEAEI